MPPLPVRRVQMLASSGAVVWTWFVSPPGFMCETLTHMLGIRRVDT